MTQPTKHTRIEGPSPRRNEGGFAMIATMLVMVLISALATTALLRSRMDVTVAGNYKAQRAAEVVADSALEMTKAMLYGSEGRLVLPLSIPTTDAAARAWRGGADTTGDGVGDGVTYNDGAVDLRIEIKYKQEDSINYNGAETFADEVVRYGTLYNYQGGKAGNGTQPVYTVTSIDSRTGVRSEADLLTTIGFRTPAAIFVKGTVEMRKYQWATQESIEVTSGTGTPALATTQSSVTIEAPASKPDDTAPGKTYTSQYCTGSGCNYVVDAGYIHPDVYLPATITAEYNAGRCVNARDWAHILLGVGNRNDATYPAAGGAGACDTAASNIFKFYRADQANDPEIIQLNYVMPTPATLETMLGATFPDLKAIADKTYVQANYSSVSNAVGNSSRGLIFSTSSTPMGTATDPKIVFFESNMDAAGNRSGDPLMLGTTPAGYSISGYGILVIDGDADIFGSIDWTGLMIVRGHLVFKPYENGTDAVRSGPTLKSDWKGFIMIGGNLQLWTYWGGKIMLGYSSSDVANVRGIIAQTIPSKVLSWRRSYN